jgi:hypothetical protein
MTRDELKLIGFIADRAVNLTTFYGAPVQKIDVMMDIQATIDGGVPLRLQDLLNADSGNFIHDIVGIRNNLNRKTGKLENCFSPRFTDRKVKA